MNIWTTMLMYSSTLGETRWRRPFEQCAMAIFGYMTDTETVEPIDTVEVKSEGDDMESLLFHYLDDWLFKFSADLFFIPRVGRRVQLGQASTGDRGEGHHLLSHAGP